MVCERELESERSEGDDRAKFFYKEPPRFDGDSDIVSVDFEYSTKVISEVPLALEIEGVYSGWHLKKGSKEFREAKKLLQRYCIY